MSQNRSPKDLVEVDENESVVPELGSSEVLSAESTAQSSGADEPTFPDVNIRIRPQPLAFKDEDGCEKPTLNIVVEHDVSDFCSGGPLVQDEGPGNLAAAGESQGGNVIGNTSNSEGGERNNSEHDSGTSDLACAIDSINRMDLESLDSDSQEALPALPPVPVTPRVRVNIGRAIVRLLGSLILVCALVAALFFFWGRPLLAAIDRLCCQNSYSAVPVARLVNPLLGSRQERETYGCALAKVRDGLNREIGRDYLSAARKYREALRQLQKLQNKDLPLGAYIYLRLGSCENHEIPIPAGTEFHSIHRQARNDLLQSRFLASSLISPDNFVVAMAEREVARAYLASELLTAGHAGVVPCALGLWDAHVVPEESSMIAVHIHITSYAYKVRPGEALTRAQQMVQAALELDLKGNHGPAAAVMEDQELLSSIYLQAHDYTNADRAWSEYLSQCKNLKGEQSLYYAHGLIDHATYLATSHRLPESILFAKQAMRSLTAHPLICFSDWLEPAMNKETIANSIRTYLAIARKLQPDEIAKIKNADEFLLSVDDLEDALIKWGANNYSRLAQFDQLVSLADSNNYAGNYTQADHLYKKALLLESSNSKKQWQNPTVSDWYVLCMAKTAKNDLQRGAIKEAATIGENCLRIINPYDNWFPSHQHRFAWAPERVPPVVEELVFGFGSAHLQSPEVKKVVAGLRLLLESSNSRDRLVYLAALEDLQGNVYRTECAYKEAAEQSRRTHHQANAGAAIAALAAFYEKEGKYELAGTLFEQAEQALKANGLTSNQGTLTNLARLKRLMSLSPDQSVFAPYDWLNDARRDIAKSRTSYELASHFYLIDLRPLIRDYRTVINPNASTAGYVYSVRCARADLSKLSESQRKLAREQFKWYGFCFPSNPEKAREILVRESLSAETQPDMLSRPHSPAELIPDQIMIISNEDARKLEKLLGHKLSSGH